MKLKNAKVALCGVTAAMIMTGMGMQAHAASLSDVLPVAGIGVTLSDGTSLQDIKENVSTSVTTKDGLSFSIAELNDVISGNCAKSSMTSPLEESMMKDVVPSASTTSASATSEEVLAAESTVETPETKSSGSAAFVKVLQTNVLTNAATSLDLNQLLSATKFIDIPDSDLDITSDSTVSSNDEESTETEEDTEKEIEKTMSPAEAAVLAAQAAASGEENFSSLVIAQVYNYVNVRKTPSEDGEVVGKLYNKSVGTFISQQDGWYEITSGNVTGYVKAEYCVTGDDAVALAEEVGTRIATVNTTTLKVREDASTDSEVIGMVPDGEELTVSDEEDGWIQVNIEEGDGWVSSDYVTMKTEFVQAESKEEEEARLAKENAEKEAAQNSSKKNTSTTTTSDYNSASSYVSAGGGSASGNAVAQFALQFVGNPYVYGGTSLTNGADCSGFVMSVYKNFGVSLPHSSSADRSVGSTVSSLAEAQPGDLICYSGHVALYIGDGKIVHASTSKTGIITSTANYRTILAIRRIF